MSVDSSTMIIAVEGRYGSNRHIERIRRLVPKAEVVPYEIRTKNPSFQRFRGLCRRMLPWFAYSRIEGPLDNLADAQKIIWQDKPTAEHGSKRVLLWSPQLQPATGARLVGEFQPHWIHSLSTGVDKIPALKGVELTNAGGVNSLRIAEFAIGMIFALAKNVHTHVQQGENRVWNPLKSDEVHGKVLGIIGVGSIGGEVARLGKALGMQVWGVRRQREPNAFVDRMFDPDRLDEFLPVIDYLVLSIPLMRHTRGLISHNAFSLMKPSSFLINISRGRVVDEDALFQALKTNTIKGASIDVFQDEKPLPRNSRFYTLPNLIITSYSAFYTHKSLDDFMEIFFENLRRYAINDNLMNKL